MEQSSFHSAWEKPADVFDKNLQSCVNIMAPGDGEPLWVFVKKLSRIQFFFCFMGNWLLWSLFMFGHNYEYCVRTLLFVPFGWKEVFSCVFTIPTQSLDVSSGSEQGRASLERCLAVGEDSSSGSVPALCLTALQCRKVGSCNFIIARFFFPPSKYVNRCCSSPVSTH